MWPRLPSTVPSRDGTSSLRKESRAFLEQGAGGVVVLSTRRGGAQVAERPGDPEVVAELARDFEGGLPAFLREGNVAEAERDRSTRGQCPEPHGLVRVVRTSKRLVEPASSFAEVAAHLPEQP